METERSSPDRPISHAQEVPSNESDPLLDDTNSSETTQSAKKRLLIYAFPALLIW